MAVDPAAAARWIVSRHERRRKALRRRLQSAQEDAARIISAIAAQYRPLRIYQWGSLVHTQRFTEISDIDIAVEGMDCDEPTLAAIRTQADSMTDFHVDLVVMERLEAREGRPHPAVRRSGMGRWRQGLNAASTS